MGFSAAAPARENSAFTRTDLLAVLVTLAILAVLLLPALARTHVRPQGMQCIENLRQITVGWWMYVNDNEGRLAPNRGLFPANFDYNTYPRWVAGDMRGSTISGQTTIDAVNSQLLVNPKYSLLAPYVQNPALYRCPADRSTWSVNGVETPRVRSYSENGAIGPLDNGQTVSTYGGTTHYLGHWLSGGGNHPSDPWRVYIKESDLVAPSPSGLILMVDEHPNSINDAYFAFQMPANPSQTYWIDPPTIAHNNAAGLSYADGHVEMHRWLRPGGIPPAIWAADTVPLGNTINPSIMNNPDVLWMAHRITAPMPGTNPYYP